MFNGFQFRHHSYIQVEAELKGRGRSSKAITGARLPNTRTSVIWEAGPGYAKQQNRRIPTCTLPSPTLNIPLDSYTSFVSILLVSTRILALLGAGLSAASGIPTFRGTGGFWRKHDATQLATPEAFAQNPSLLWQFYNHRRHMALEAVPNKAHMVRASRSFPFSSQTRVARHARHGFQDNSSRVIRRLRTLSEIEEVVLLDDADPNLDPRRWQS